MASSFFMQFLNKQAAHKIRTQLHNAIAARKLKEKIAKELKAGAGKGVEAGIRFLAARWKETLSVPAPKRSAWTERHGVWMKEYRATTPAIKGAPPRVVSAQFRNRVTTEMIAPTVGVVGTNARSPEGFNYPAFHELNKSRKRKGGWGQGKHMSLKPTVDKFIKELRIIVGTAFKAVLRIKR